MKRLYQIIDAQTGTPIKGVFFGNRLDAKQARKRHDEEAKGPRYIVGPGPDHWKYKPTDGGK